MKNKYYESIIKKGYDINITSHQYRMFRMYLVKNNIRTGEFVEFKHSRTKTYIHDRAPSAREHTALSNALYSLSEIVKNKT